MLPDRTCVVAAATIEKLIDKLVDESYQGTWHLAFVAFINTSLEEDYVDSFFSCHDYFIRQEDLLKLLLIQFNHMVHITPDKALSEWQLHKRKRYRGKQF